MFGLFYKNEIWSEPDPEPDDKLLLISSDKTKLINLIDELEYYMLEYHQDFWKTYAPIHVNCNDYNSIFKSNEIYNRRKIEVELKQKDARSKIPNDILKYIEEIHWTTVEFTIKELKVI